MKDVMMDDSAYLPMDIIVMILSRLPVKSVLKFKAVCKSWNALIASPPFIRSHLLHFNASNSNTLFIAITLHFTFGRFQDGMFEIEDPNRPIFEIPDDFNTILCYCKGILLLQCRQHELILWNPSIRKVDRLYLPFRFDASETLGLCYDPVLADLKIVAATWEKYAIFSCNNRSWKKGKVGGSLGSRGSQVDDTVCVDGAVCWKFMRSSNGFIVDVVCFESEGDKFKTLQKPNYLKPTDEFNLICLRDRLCVWFCNVDEAVVRIWMKDEVNIWMEFMKIVNIPHPFKWEQPVYVGENEIIVRLKNCRVLLYRPCEKTYEESVLPWSTCHEMVRSVDSLLFFSTSRRNRKRSIHLQ